MAAPTPTVIRLKEVPKTCKKSTLEVLFFPFGKVEKVEVIKDKVKVPNGSLKKRHAKIYMASREEASAAFAKLNNVDFMGLKLEFEILN